jgi:hypothetical protein
VRPIEDRYAGPVWRWAREDVIQAAALGRLQSQRDGEPETARNAAARRSIRRTVAEIALPRGCVDPGEDFDIRQVDESFRVPAPSGREVAAMTRKQKIKFYRNGIITAASRAGVNQHMLSEIFGIARSQIAAIIAAFEAKYGSED